MSLSTVATEQVPALVNVEVPETKTKAKLHGRAFYESIGSPKLVLAPMVDRSDFAWRLLTRSFMTPEESKSLLAYTPMFHARLFGSDSKVRAQAFEPTRSSFDKVPEPGHTPSASDVLRDGRKDLDRPLTVQFCANDPDAFLQAAKYVQPYCDAVDLNLGCPQGIARKGHYGAFLQEDWGLIYKLINKLHLDLDIPITAKCRIQETKEKTLEYAKMILSAGASILTVHGRQRHQKGHNTGLADWSVIRYLRDNLPPETVIFANGNILRHEDIERCLKETGADGVMSAEANLHDPSIFASLPQSVDERLYWRGRKGKGGYRIDAVFRRYMSILYEYVLETAEPERQPLFVPSDPKLFETQAGAEDSAEERPAKRQKKSKPKSPTSPSLKVIQGHLFDLLRPLVTIRTEVRDALARSRAGDGDISAFEDVLTLTEKAVAEGILEYEAHPEKFDAEMAEDGEIEGDIADYESSLKAARACKRPWWCCQSYVRPVPKEAIEKGSMRPNKKQQEEIDRGKGAIEAMKPGSTEELSEREKGDIEGGLDKKEVPAAAMIAG